MADYTYSIINDFPQATAVLDLLVIEVGNSLISEPLLAINQAGDDVSFSFALALSAPDELLLDDVVANHYPLGAATPSVALRSDFVVDTVWADFKKYLDGTIASLYFYTQVYSDRYVIITEAHGGLRHQYTLPFTDVADKTDYDTNFAPEQPIRRPYEQNLELSFTNKESEIFYLVNGDIDRMEVTVGGQKKIDQFNYDIDGNLISITTTLEAI